MDGEFFGYVASGLVFATFYMRTMLPLRIIAIASNVAFLLYAAFQGLTPVLLLHGTLLPLNVLRLLQIHEHIAQVERAATPQFSAQGILPFMQKRLLRAGETLFKIGDPAEELFYVTQGEIHLPEVQQTLGAGEFLGEIAIFSNTGRRTASAIARTDATVMSLTRKAVFNALIHYPQLGIHLLRVVTIRLLENAHARGDIAELHDQMLAQPSNDAPQSPPEPLYRRIFGRIGPRTRIALIAAIAAVPLVLALFQPLYVVLERDAAVTSWLNVATAPIAGTVEAFETRVGGTVDAAGAVAAIANYAADRGGVIRAEGQERRAEARWQQATQYAERVARLARDWTERRVRYAEGFRRDLDIEIQDLEQRIALLTERETLAGVSARRKRTLRATGMGSQADEDHATSEYRDLQVARTQAAMALERVRERRRLAGAGVFIQADGKEPEWSWRSIDEIDLEVVRAMRAATDAHEELANARSVLADERQNYKAVSTVTIRVPPGMTIWSSAVTNNASVKQGDQLFSWVDCSKMLVDVPVTETLAALLQAGMRAVVSLEGDLTEHAATVLLTRGASSRLEAGDLASVSHGHTRGTAQALVQLANVKSIRGCPIGRRAFVSFPEIRTLQYVRAYLPGL